MKTIAIFAQTSEQTQKASELAQALQLPLAHQQHDYDYLLVVAPDYIGLQKTGLKSHPLYIDFIAGTLNYRRQHTSLRREMLARAMGLKSKTAPYIVDATAGLGRDSFILASLGFDITLLERSPIIHALLNDGLQRAAQDPQIAPIIQRLHLIQTDAIAWMKTATPKPDIIYLDPMFPQRTKSALVKKDMQIFHNMVGNDPDADLLLPAALACATKRVVVKRPRLAEYLSGMSPTFSTAGSSNRFDVYLR